MTESTHVALKLSELIRNRFPATTKQKKIVEALKAKGVEVSEGLLSRLFNGFYEVRLDSRLFKELHRLLAAPHESQEDFWQNLLQDYDPAAHTDSESIKIGLSLKSFWARPFVTMLINKSLPKPFEVVYGQRVRKKFNEYAQVKEKTHLKYLSAKSLDIPHTNVSFDGLKVDYIPTNVIPTGALYDTVYPDGQDTNDITNYSCENDEWLLSQSLQELLNNDTLQIIAVPDTTKGDFIPICQICSGVVLQMLIFEKESISNSGNQPVHGDKMNAYSPTSQEVNVAVEKLFDTLINENPENNTTDPQKRIKELLKYKQYFTERLDKTLDVRTFKIRDMEFSLNKKDNSSKNYNITVTYNPYLRSEIDDEKIKEEYLDRIVNCFDLERLKAAVENDNDSNYFWVRSIYNTLSGELLADFISILKARKEKNNQDLELLRRLKPSIDSPIMDYYSQEMEFHKKEAQKWDFFYKLFANRVSRPICMYSEEFLYKKQIKDRIVEDILKPLDDSNTGGYFVLVGFIPFADKILWDIVKYYNRARSSNSQYQLKVNRFNLSNLIGKRITTNLYVRKEFLKQLAEEGRLPYIDRLIDQLKKSVYEFQNNELLKRQLAFHHFYFEDTDRSNEFRRMNEVFHQDTELMESYLQEYDSSEKINEFEYTITRTDEYARFLEELLSKR